MTIVSGAVPRRALAGAVVRAAGRTMKRWWLAYMTWRIERLAISRLSAMSDRQLKDIGILRSQIEIAVKGETEDPHRSRFGALFTFGSHRSARDDGYGGAFL